MTIHYEIDIRTKFISEDRKCYIIFPGDGYRFYSVMRDEFVVFLDLPGFPIGQLEDISESKDLVARLVLSERIRDWYFSETPEGQPNRNLAEIGKFRNTQARIQFAGLIRNFFSELKVGDVVIVPPQNFEDEVLFGEITSAARATVKVPRYSNDLIPALKVEWVARVSRNKIPGWLERKIPRPNPIRQIEKSFHDYIFDIMYERYFYNEQFVCKFKVETSNFSSLDDYLFQQFVLYTGALHEKKHDSSLSGMSTVSIASAAATIEQHDDIPELRININSPGHIVVFTKNIIPLVAGALMTLAASAGPELALAAPVITVTNSSDSTQVSADCQAGISDEVIDDLNAMGYARWQELCEIELKARHRTGMNAGMGVIAHPEAPHNAPKGN